MIAALSITISITAIALAVYSWRVNRKTDQLRRRHQPAGIVHGAESVTLEDGQLIHTRHNLDGTTTRTPLTWEDLEEDTEQ